MEVWWLEQSVSDVPASDDWLAPGEKLRLDAMPFPKRRSDWCLGRWTAKRAVAAYLKVACDSELLVRIEIRSAESGAPKVFLDDNPAKSLRFPLHRAGFAACAVALSELTIGCDLELIEPRSDAFLADYFTASEQALVSRAPSARCVTLSNLIWSAKESALKALEVGLRYDTRSVEVSLDEISASGIFKHEPDHSPADASDQTWHWHPLTVRCTNGQSLLGWWISSDDFVRTIVTMPSSTAPTILSGFQRRA